MTMSNLDLRVVREIRPYRDGDLEGVTSEAKAIAEMARQSGLLDKSLAIEVGVDPTLFSKAQHGSARLSEQQTNALMDACGSELWLSYWLVKRGYDPRSVRRFESDIERENRELRERIEQMERERAVEIRLLRDMRAG